MWQQFRAELRHFTKTQLDVLLGAQNQGVPAIAFAEHDEDPRVWTDADRRAIGEFLSVDHARLAHEIALHGMPGGAEVFPALTGGALSADSIGLVARSHGRAAARSGRLPRVGEPGEPPPAWGGPAVPHGTASHRQLSEDPTRFARLRCCFGYASRRRARASTSGTSTARSRACPGMTRTGSHCSSKSTVRTGYARACSSARCSKDCKPSSTRPRACCARSTGSGRSSALRIARQRVRSNLLEQSLHERMPYVPRPARLKSGEDLFRLIVSELYGDHPEVGGRELLQNAVDAVRERWRLEALQWRTRARDLP